MINPADKPMQHLPDRRPRLTTLGITLALVLWAGLGRGAIAIIPPMMELEPTRLFRQTKCFGDSPIATDKEILQQGLTPPSLWMTRDLLGGKIVDRWTIHGGNDQLPPWVEVTFNLQPWNNLEYPRQYAYLNEFGRVARGFGYNVRVCNGLGDTLAAQFCDWETMRGGATCPIYLPGGFSARGQSPLF